MTLITILVYRKTTESVANHHHFTTLGKTLMTQQDNLEEVHMATAALSKLVFLTSCSGTDDKRTSYEDGSHRYRVSAADKTLIVSSTRDRHYPHPSRTNPAWMIVPGIGKVHVQATDERGESVAKSPWSVTPRKSAVEKTETTRTIDS